jgi:hypothetical protein
MEKRRPGRPKVENRMKSFSVVMEQDIMDTFDALAIMNDKNRSVRMRELVVWDIEQQTGLQEQ